MPRVTSGAEKKRRIKGILRRATGYRGRRKNVLRVARQAVDKADIYAYRDRRQRKRDFRRMWIVRINAAARIHGLTYGRLMDMLHKCDIAVDRKQLAQMAVERPEHFQHLLSQCQRQVS